MRSETPAARALAYFHRFALGWLVARRERLHGQIPPALREFSKSRRFWERG